LDPLGDRPDVVLVQEAVRTVRPLVLRDGEAKRRQVVARQVLLDVAGEAGADREDSAAAVEGESRSDVREERAVPRPRVVPTGVERSLALARERLEGDRAVDLHGPDPMAAAPVWQ